MDRNAKTLNNHGEEMHSNAQEMNKIERSWKEKIWKGNKSEMELTGKDENKQIELKSN